MEKRTQSRLERRVANLELLRLPTMEESVGDYLRRHPPKGGKDAGKEKRLYAQLAHIMLSAPDKAIPALLRLFPTTSASRLADATLTGTWRVYRLSTVRLERGTGWQGPMCFPGAAGEGGIADVGLFLNPTFDGNKGRQIQADVILYFELKSADHYSYNASQVLAHLAALARSSITSRVGYLGAIGGRAPNLPARKRWLGHVTLRVFLEAMRDLLRYDNARLAREIAKLLSQASD